MLVITHVLKTIATGWVSALIFTPEPSLSDSEKNATAMGVSGTPNHRKNSPLVTISPWSLSTWRA